MYSLLSLGYCLLYNYTGIINLAYFSQFALGAYGYALISRIYPSNFIFPLLLVIISAIFFAFILSLLTRKFVNDYVALITLGAAVIVDALLKNLNSITNGPLGISDIKNINLLFYKITSPSDYLFLLIIVTLIMLFFLNYIRNRYGYYILLAIKSDDQLMSTLGYNVKAIKSFVYILSGLIAAVTGMFYASYIKFIDPYTFSIYLLTPILLISALAGDRPSYLHILFYTTLVILFPEIIKNFQLPQYSIGPLQQIIFILTLIIIMLSQKQYLIAHVKN